MSVKEKIQKIKENRKLLALTVIAAAFLIVGLGSGLFFYKNSNNRGAVFFETQNLGDKRSDVNIPSSIWRYVEKDYDLFNLKKESSSESEAESAKSEGESKSAEAEKEKPKAKDVTPLSAEEINKRLVVDKKEVDDLMKRHPPSEVFPFKLLLIEKTSGVLSGKNYELQFPPGGGVLDLAKYVSDSTRGSFYLKVVWDQKVLPSKFTKIYFLSRSKEREVTEINSFKESKHVKLGMGCDHSYDLTEFWQKSMKYEGIFLNTTSDRHISLLSGQFYFSVFIDGKIYNSSLEILDSNHRDLLCVQ